MATIKEYGDALDRLFTFESGTSSSAYELAEAMYKAWGKIMDATDAVEYDELNKIIEEQMEEIQYLYEFYQEEEESRQELQDLVDEMEAEAEAEDEMEAEEV